MYKKLLWIIIALVSSFVLNTAVFAHSSYCREGLSRMVQMINLNDEQKAKIKPILEQLKTSLKTAGSQMGDLRTQLSDQVNSANMDQAKVDGLVDQKVKLIGDMIKAKITARSQILSILNPQQKERLQSMIKKVEEKMAAKFKNCNQDD